MGYTEKEKQIYAILLVAGLIFVFFKVLYERYQKEQFSVYNIFHPIKNFRPQNDILLLNILFHLGNLIRFRKRLS